jgi:hypothetical protein
LIGSGSEVAKLWKAGNFLDLLVSKETDMQQSWQQEI